MNTSVSVGEEFQNLVDLYIGGRETPEELKALMEICRDLKHCSDQIPNSLAKDLSNLFPPLPDRHQIHTYGQGARAILDHIKLTKPLGAR